MSAARITFHDQWDHRNGIHAIYIQHTMLYIPLVYVPVAFLHVYAIPFFSAFFFPFFFYDAKNLSLHDTTDGVVRESNNVVEAFKPER